MSSSKDNETIRSTASLTKKNETLTETEAHPQSSSSKNPIIPPRSHHAPIQQFLTEAISATNPSIRHLASHSSFNSQSSHGTSHSKSNAHSPASRSRSQKHVRKARPLSTTYENQRFSGTEKRYSKNTKTFDPFGDEGVMKGGLDLGNENPTTVWGSVDLDTESKNINGKRTSLYQQAGEDALEREMEFPGAGMAAGESCAVNGDEKTRDLADENDVGLTKEEDEDENIYPKPLGLFILITGIALSVFLISLDRTIITTAVPYITSEFNSSNDIGWYGSSYLLTASAFQPLYGRIYMLFNMKWSYLISLGLFELGSLICGVAPDSVTLIIGRAIAGLGSAGILTGSFVVVSHAVPLAKRPILTAVVGLMFGVGATAGPLLGGVFTDLVTWRWCFYINLPVGGATVFAMLFFFNPPKSHFMANKSFFYRIMELDLIGNLILLGASIMLFLALQLTEERTPWSSSEVVGLLTGSGCTFIVFSVWMWWKADGALMPPRIIGQRTVAAACAAGFCIYSAILIQTYYLPIYFQAIRNRSAIKSGIDMIPYVVANAIFSLIAGIFVAKNGYFTAPAIIGMCIATVGCGLLSTIGENTSTAVWVGYEILASAGFGMAIQQGFTAVQIVLPLDEVAIGTAAVVAFQSLGGAVFVSVGNTILQNSLFGAHIPGVDIETVISDGAATFREHLTTEQIPLLVDVYNSALQRVFTAAIPMAGLAVIACAFMEWRNVKDQNRKDEEMQRKMRRQREEAEAKLVESARRDKMVEGKGIWGNKRFSVASHAS